MIGWQIAFRTARELEKRQKWSSAVKAYRAIIAAGEEGNARVHFHLGNALFRLNELGDAAKSIENALEIDSSVANWHYRFGFILERQKRHQMAVSAYQNAVAINPDNPAWHYRLYKCHSALGNHEIAFSHLRDALNGDPANPSYHDLVASELRSRGPRWQEAQALERGLPYHESDPAWHVRMGDSYSALSRHLKAAKSYRRAYELRPDADVLLREGEQWERAGRTKEAEHSFSAALATKPKSEESRFGVGAHYQRQAKWDRAAEAYERRIATQPLDAELHFRAALAHDRCFQWEKAAARYLSAVSLDMEQPYWHYKLGFAYERSGAWEEAAEAYEYAASQESANPYWWYRAGYVSAKSGNWQQACSYFVRSAPKGIALIQEDEAPDMMTGPYLNKLTSRRMTMRETARSSEFHRKIADSFATQGNWPAAADGYEHAVFTSDEHDPKLYYAWGHALMRAGRLHDAVDAFLQTRIFMTPDGIDVPRYIKNKSLKHSMQYLEYYETVGIRQKTILWETNHGSSVGCHPLALFRHIVDLPEFANYRHIWAVNDVHFVPQDLKERGNVFFTKLHSDLYLRILATASHLVNNVSFPPYFMRREGQRYLNTWHGTPFKTLGKDMQGEALEHSNLARNFLHSSHIMSPNQHTSWAIIERHDLTGLFKGRICVTGSPRLDNLINNAQSLRSEIRARLDIPEHTPVVLYAPTWRGSTRDRVLDRDALISDLEAMTGDGYQLIFRAHRLTENLLADLDLDVTVVPADIDTSDLLSAVDVLITDYSSIAFDFMPTGRPIVYYAYDYDEYRTERGLYLEPAEMPGDFCYNRSDLLKTLRRTISSDTPQTSGTYASAVKRFAPLEDGEAAARVTDFFFREAPLGTACDETAEQLKVPITLFHHSLIPNGIATSFRNLTASIPSDQVRKVLVAEPHVLNKDQARLSQFQMLPDDVQVVGRIGTQALRPEERWLQERFTREHRLASEAQWQIYDTAMKREFYRVFGPVSFDAAIEFDGYSPFWTALVASGGEESTRRSIYMHNDMLNEWQMKFANLEAVFGLYPRFDQLISVSKSLGEKNAIDISEAFGVDRKLFTYCNNQIDAETVMLESKAKLDKDIYEWFSKASKNVVNIGRMSPEKDHAKLIEAFIRYHAVNPDANLLIIGDGPLRSDLEYQIRSSGAQDFVMLAGQRPNPYPALAQASVFVLSSLHEGQPMVLFEAMILGIPILCTDMPGPRDILEDIYGLIVENSVEGILGGLNTLEQDGVPTEVFDAAGYRKNTARQFYETALELDMSPA